jgi:hypothetical protein
MNHQDCVRKVKPQIFEDRWSTGDTSILFCPYFIYFNGFYNFSVTKMSLAFFFLPAESMEEAPAPPRCGVVMTALMAMFPARVYSVPIRSMTDVWE